MAGFGQYDLGASQFGGGGFMASPQPAADNGFGREKKRSNTDSLRAVNLRQLKKENEKRDDEGWSLDGQELNTLTFVGKVKSYEENAAQAARFLVEDSTDSITVMTYLQDKDTEVLSRQRADLQPGNYVRVYGHLSRFDNDVHVKAYAVKPVNDKDELTYHNLQVIFQHLAVTRGSAPPPGAMGGGMAPGPSTMPMGGGYAKPGAPGMHPSGGQGGQQQAHGAPPAAGGGNGHVTPIQTAILEIASDAARQGSSVTPVAIHQALVQRGFNVPFDQAKREGLFLVNNGHMYEEADEVWRACI